MRPLGGLYGINFFGFLFDFCLYMGGHRASAVFPFGRGIKEFCTVFSGGIFDYSLASIALFHDGVTGAPIKLASLFGHEYTIKSYPYS
jgi:hypothetical protein